MGGDSTLQKEKKTVREKTINNSWTRAGRKKTSYYRTSWWEFDNPVLPCLQGSCYLFVIIPIKLNSFFIRKFVKILCNQCSLKMSRGTKRFRMTKSHELLVEYLVSSNIHGTNRTLNCNIHSTNRTLNYVTHWNRKHTSSCD